MSELSFAELFEQSLQEDKFQTGSLIIGTVVGIDKETVLVDAGMKSESAIPKSQFEDANGDLEVAVGDEVEVYLETLEDGFGETRLSREKAKRAKTWDRLETALEDNETVTGLVTGKVKGGLTVDVEGVRGFLPGSLVDVRPIRDFGFLEGKEVELKLVKLDRKRNNVVVSRRAVIEAENSVEREALLANMEEGVVLDGIVKNLTDYGAFIDLGGIDGLLHITDMAWRRVNHPSEVIQVGDEIKVKVLKFDREKNRVSLGMKQLQEDPWTDMVSRYPMGSEIMGKVANITDYGAFIEIEDGIEGLVHTSELDWTNRNIHPSKVVHLGQEVKVKILDVDQERRRISLSIKQCTVNPWEAFSATHSKGDKITGSIKSITDFGIFIGLDGNIDGLVHLTDISWSQPGEEAVREYKKGDELETVILSIDPERERISLGLKQLEQDPFGEFVAENGKNSIVTGTVKSVDDKGAVIDLADDVEGYLRVSELDEDTRDAASVLKVGDQVEAKIVNVDRKNRNVSLSVKAKAAQEEANAVKNYASNQPQAQNTLGDLLKGQLSSDD
ncbi:MAG: 30S ribosomal protein S1 [Piscirickettsiaceae bacterium CG_4_9_14_3_um_filter_43_564]|nr:30S ribosomal protein S1 [Thiomicrospira sp.]OIP95964.1 MAG: 30S ribosomal protein S1 [Thiomicrospira sp. CG2_30_44_34]PIQ04006.1 MAG: 30S ribosomal protein S1 [Piscirickettsiaceae bacterium CG18_big_fil_WC_8_21_14_2_50_44_103]PIU39326.1 MAG: 30S ribosomal protein S1 [Piscirickettsiaceae bacterium CG07_land_8_20_14_0_80_44_28]PIW56950.1 MAG: 30S ribosomal protein S1 [Piscirickettsiaceae bacterium CG12_big_fil_rev_8_21_14_0_65_44_934]PIW77126.1 MAG: 30S ribosomal protein S1 [Piscirickettsiac